MMLNSRFVNTSALIIKSDGRRSPARNRLGCRLRIAQFLGLLLFLNACNCPAGRRSAFRQPTHYKGYRRLHLIAEPRLVTDEYISPEEKARQVFAWGPFGAEWRFMPADFRKSQAGFDFAAPCDLSSHRSETVLSFAMKPHAADYFLDIALLDGRHGDDRVLTSVNIHKFRLWKYGRWAHYGIPLTAFGNKGRLLHEGTASSKRFPVDWKNIDGIRLISHTNVEWNGFVIIRNLQFGPVPLGMRLRSAIPD